MPFTQPELAVEFFRPDHALSLNDAVKARLVQPLQQFLRVGKRVEPVQVPDRDPLLFPATIRPRPALNCKKTMGHVGDNTGERELRSRFGPVLGKHSRRKTKRSRLGQMFFRAIQILTAFFAVAGAVAWTYLLIALKQWGNAMAGMGDGAGTDRGSSVPETLLAGAIWVLPTMGFVFMLLGSLNLLKGTTRRIGYWYSLLFLILTATALFVFYPGVTWLRPLALVFMFFAGLWGFTFREKAEPVAPLVAGEPDNDRRS